MVSQRLPKLLTYHLLYHTIMIYSICSALVFRLTYLADALYCSHVDCRSTLSYYCVGTYLYYLCNIFVLEQRHKLNTHIIIRYMSLSYQPSTCPSVLHWQNLECKNIAIRHSLPSLNPNSGSEFWGILRLGELKCCLTFPNLN